MCSILWLCTEGAKLVREHNCRFHVLGNWITHAAGIRSGVEQCQAAQGTGQGNSALLMAYDGREEILHAAEGEQEGFEERLWTAMLPPVDLVLEVAVNLIYQRVFCSGK